MAQQNRAENNPFETLLIAECFHSRFFILPFILFYVFQYNQGVILL
jgi:hypothetical protein